MQLIIPRTNTRIGTRAFSVAAPTIWNSLPLNVRDVATLGTFQSHLKKHFSCRHTAFSHVAPRPRFGFSSLKSRYKFVYLLTYLLTSNAAVYAETGRYPLSVKYFGRCIKYWLNVRQMDNNRYPKSRGVISTFSWGQSFFYFSMPLDY